VPAAPQIQILANGRYSAMLTNAGSDNQMGEQHFALRHRSDSLFYTAACDKAVDQHFVLLSDTMRSTERLKLDLTHHW